MRLEDLPATITGDRFRLERSENFVKVVRLGDDVTVGHLELEPSAEGLLVRSLCIDEPHRSYGAGSEAAVLFNRVCDAAKVPIVRAWAPPDRGLAVYFWIRMGFRPLHGEGLEGGLWFERSLDRS